MNSRGTEGSEQYFIRVRGKVLGPFTLEKLKALRSRGQFSRIHEISTDRTNWEPAANIEPMLGFGRSPAESGVPAPATTTSPPVEPLAASAPAGAGPVATWHYSAGGERLGPVSILELRDLIRRGLIGVHDFVWKEGMADWCLMSDVPELQTLTQVPSPPQQRTSPVDGFPADDGIHHTSGMAIASMVLGILGLMTPFMVFNILATIFGGVAIKSINKSRIQLGGRGMAISGLVMGVIGLAFWLTFFLIWSGLFARIVSSQVSDAKTGFQKSDQWQEDNEPERRADFAAEDEGTERDDTPNRDAAEPDAAANPNDEEPRDAGAPANRKASSVRVRFTIFGVEPPGAGFWRVETENVARSRNRFRDHLSALNTSC